MTQLPGLFVLEASTEMQIPCPRCRCTLSKISVCEHCKSHREISKSLKHYGTKPKRHEAKTIFEGAKRGTSVTEHIFYTPKSKAGSDSPKERKTLIEMFDQRMLHEKLKLQQLALPVVTPSKTLQIPTLLHSEKQKVVLDLPSDDSIITSFTTTFARPYEKTKFKYIFPQTGLEKHKLRLYAASSSSALIAGIRKTQPENMYKNLSETGLQRDSYRTLTKPETQTREEKRQRYLHNIKSRNDQDHLSQKRDVELKKSKDTGRAKGEERSKKKSIGEKGEVRGGVKGREKGIERGGMKGTERSREKGRKRGEERGGGMVGTRDGEMERIREKSRERGRETVGERGGGRSSERGRDKGIKKIGEKGAQRSRELGREIGEERGGEKDDESASGTGGGEKSAESSSEKGRERGEKREEEGSGEKAGGRVSDRGGEKDGKIGGEESAKRSREKSTEGGVERVMERGGERSDDRSDGTDGEKGGEKGRKKGDERGDEKGGGKGRETPLSPGEKGRERGRKRLGERGGENVGERGGENVREINVGRSREKGRANVVKRDKGDKETDGETNEVISGLNYEEIVGKRVGERSGKKGGEKGEETPLITKKSQDEIKVKIEENDVKSKMVSTELQQNKSWLPAIPSDKTKKQFPLPRQKEKDNKGKQYKEQPQKTKKSGKQEEKYTLMQDKPDEPSVHWDKSKKKPSYNAPEKKETLENKEKLSASIEKKRVREEKEDKASKNSKSEIKKKTKVEKKRDIPILRPEIIMYDIIPLPKKEVKKTPEEKRPELMAIFPTEEQLDFDAYKRILKLKTADEFINKTTIVENLPKNSDNDIICIEPQSDMFHVQHDFLDIECIDDKSEDEEIKIKGPSKDIKYALSNRSNKDGTKLSTKVHRSSPYDAAGQVRIAASNNLLSLSIGSLSTSFEIGPPKVIKYALSDRSYIDNGWTQLPAEKVVRKMFVYRSHPAQPEFDWFRNNKDKGIVYYDTGEKLAELDDTGYGRWYYKNGLVAMDYHKSENTIEKERIVVYSNGEPDVNGIKYPITPLAMFDKTGNGIVFDHRGKIRINFNQSEGMVHDPSIGPSSYWKWHSLNDPPNILNSAVDTFSAEKDPNILKLQDIDKPKRFQDSNMLTVEFQNFVKEVCNKQKQKFFPFHIKMKALKINKQFSLKIMDQTKIFLKFGEGLSSLKINLGIFLDPEEVVDTEITEIGIIANSVLSQAADTDSKILLQEHYNKLKKINQRRSLHESRIRNVLPVSSADRMLAGKARLLRHPPLYAYPGVCTWADDHI